MSVFGAINSNPAAVIASVSSAAQSASFDIQFNNLQSTLINRFNEDQVDINETPREVEDRIAELQETQDALLTQLPLVEQFRIGNENNAIVLNDLFDNATAIFDTFNNDSTVTAEEVEAFEAARDAVADQIENLFIFTLPDINDGQVVQRLRDNNLDDLRNLTLTEGGLSDNQDVVAFLTDLQDEINTAIVVTENTIVTALALEENIGEAFIAADDEVIELTEEELTRREEATAAAEQELSILLQAISLSFTASASFAEQLSSALSPQAAQPGSILSLFA